MRQPAADRLQQLNDIRHKREDRDQKLLKALRPRLSLWQQDQLNLFDRLMQQWPVEERRPSFLLSLALYLWNLPLELRPAVEDMTDALDEWVKKQTSGDEFTAAIIRARKSGLANHPLVQEWLGTRRAVGDWATLRRGRVGLERGVKRPLSNEDLIVFLAVAHGQQKGRSLSSIQQGLLRKGLSIGRSRKSFCARVRRLGFSPD